MIRALYKRRPARNSIIVISRMLRSLAFTLMLVGGLLACDDRRQNLIRIEDGNTGGLVITSQGGQVTTYDKQNRPTCHGNEADITLPGSLRAIGGVAKVTQAQKLVGNSIALLTLKKNSFLIGTVCLDGKSKHVGVPSKHCQIDVCKLAKGLCEVLEKPGTYNLAELEHSIGNNGTLILPSLPGTFRSLIKGEWKVEVKLQVGNRIVGHIKVPAGNGWVYLEEK